MTRRKIDLVWVAACMIAAPELMHASGHGPVFGLATPTNPQGGFSFDLSLMGRYGDGAGIMFRATLGYGITENLKISVSGPVVFESEPFAPARVAAFTPMGGDFEALGIWRFHRQATGVGSRFETAAIGGVLMPGTQSLGGVQKNLHSGPGALTGIVTGIASRSQYAWASVSYQRYAESDRDRRPDVLFYSAVYGYSRPAWRTDTGWDWRIFGELTGEKTGAIPDGGPIAARQPGSPDVFGSHHARRVQELRRFGGYPVPRLPGPHADDLSSRNASGSRSTFHISSKGSTFQ